MDLRTSSAAPAPADHAFNPAAPAAPGELATPARRPIPAPVLRLAALLAAGGIFFGIATVMEPTPSVAGTGLLGAGSSSAGGARRLGAAQPPTEGQPRPAEVEVPAPATDEDGRPLLGSLVGAEHHVWIYSDASGPLYTIVSPQGRVLAAGLTADEVYRAFPKLPLHDLRLEPAGSAPASPAGPSGPLMLAVPSTDR